MSVKKIYKYGEAVLRKKCAPVERITPEIKKLIDDMFDTMYKAPGAGLAASQVGVPLRVCVIDVSPEGKRQPVALINPKIIHKKGKVVQEEGCLSFPGLFAEVKRFDNIRVQAINEKALPYEIECSGILSRAIQHELDHLDGKLFIDYLSFFKRRKLVKEIKNRKKSGNW